MNEEEICVGFTEMELSAIHGLIDRYEKNSPNEELPNLLYNLREKVRSEIIPKSDSLSKQNSQGETNE